MSSAGDQNASWWAQLFEAGRHIDAVTQQIVVLDHDIAKVDADAQRDPALLGDCFLPVGNLFLNCRSAGYRIDDRAELRYQTVAHQLDDAAAVLGKQRLHKGAPQMFHCCQRPGFVCLDEP